MRRLLWGCLLLFVLALPALGQQADEPWTSRRYYVGTIGALPGQMTLEYAHAKISGNYWYERVLTRYPDYETRDMLYVSGTLAKGTATLTEKTPDEVKSGTLRVTIPTDLNTVTGTWRSADGKKSLPVALHAVARFERLEGRGKGHIDTYETYPVFITPDVPHVLNGAIAHISHDATRVFVTEMQKAVASGETEWLKDRSFSLDYEMDIAWYSPKLISLLVMDFEDSGGAHPNTEWLGVNYAVAPTGYSKLTFADLFNADSRKALAVLMDTKAQAARRQRLGKDYGTFGDGVTPEKIDNILLTPTAVVFVFERYSIGPYVEGDYFIPVPYKELAPYLKAGGPLAGLGR